MIRVVVLGVTLLLLTGATACGGETDRASRPQSAIPPDLTVEQLYASVQRAIGARGADVVHVTIVPEGLELGSGIPSPTATDKDKSVDYSEQMWLESTTDSARFEHVRPQDQGTGSSRSSREVRRSGSVYSVDGNGNGLMTADSRCTGSDSTALAALMGCTRAIKSVAVEPGEYKGQPAILVNVRGELRSDSTMFYSEGTMFLDPTSYLPFHAEEKTSTTDPTLTKYDILTRVRYETEYLSRSSLPQDFFEPASIGFVEQKRIPADNLRPDVNGMRVYWIGANFDAGLAGPLSLSRSVLYPGPNSPGYGAMLSYEIAGDRDYRGFGMREYPMGLGGRSEADVLGEWAKPDTVREELTVQGRPAELLRLANTKYGEIYMIRIDFETTTVVVSDYLGPPPYTGRDAILRIADALRPFEP